MTGNPSATRPHVIAVDYGSNRNIFRNLVKAGAKMTTLGGLTEKLTPL